MRNVYSVELLEYKDGQSPRKIGSFSLSNDELGISIKIDKEDYPVIRNIVWEGIIDRKYAKPGRLYPYDGMVFLENLKYNFQSGEIVATEVKEEVLD